VISLTSADPTKESEFLTKWHMNQVAHDEAEQSPPDRSPTPWTACGFARVFMEGGYYNNVAQDVTNTTLRCLRVLRDDTPRRTGGAPQAPGEREFLGRVTLNGRPTMN